MHIQKGILIIIVAALAVSCKPKITSRQDAEGVRGAPFEYRITATNRPTRYDAKLIPPGGLVVDQNSGVISGNPSMAGDFKPTLSAANRFGTGEATLKLTIRESHAVVFGKELLILDPKVLQDDRAKAGGPWHFKTLFAKLAQPPSNVEDVATAWFRQWTEVRSINGDPVISRPNTEQALKDAWQNDRFRLIAIVNRMDLTRTANFDPKNVEALGEGRFIFEPFQANGNPLSFTIILEYGLPSGGTDLAVAAERWAKRWHALGVIPAGNTTEFPEEYLAELQKITDEFTAHGNLNQIRTNEIVTSPWELREFKLNEAKTGIEQVVVAQTPMIGLNNSQNLATFLRDSSGEILAGTHRVPEAMLGATSPATFQWAAPGAPARERFIFAFNTCNGCHTQESQFGGFQHVRTAGGVTQLSPLMKGVINLPEMLPNGKTAHDEMAERAALLAVFAGDPGPIPTRLQPADIQLLLRARAKRVH